jgi:hypothetical protein
MRDCDQIGSGFASAAADGSNRESDKRNENLLIQFGACN